MLEYGTKKTKEVNRMMKAYKKGGNNPYATNDPSPIKGPRNTTKNQPKPTGTTGGDLRAKGK